MTDTIFVVTIILLASLVLEYYRIWNFRALLHPGFYFAIIWLVAVPSQWYLMNHDIAVAPHPEFIDELNIFVAFAAFCFLVIIRFGSKRISLRSIDFKFINSAKLYKLLLYLTFFSVLLKFFYSLAFLGISLNLGKTRGLITSAAFSSRGTDFLDRLFSYGTIFYPLVAILGGYFLGRKIQRLPALVTSNWLIILPFIITILNVIMIGGRNPLATGIKYYLFGFAFTLSRNLSKNTRTKIFLYGIITLLAFGLFTTIVGNQRDKVLNNKYIINEAVENPVLKQFTGIMSYMGAHYWGYQLRRNDVYDPKSLGYGFYTFYGIYSVGIPFSSMLGINGNLGDLIGIEQNRLLYSVLQKDDIDGYYTTKSIFIEIICDFGIPGSFIFIALFIIYTHYLFLSVFRKPFRKATEIYFFLLCTTYWASSNFQSIYATGSIWGFILILFIYDKIQSIFFRRKINSKQIAVVKSNSEFIYTKQLSRHS